MFTAMKSYPGSVQVNSVTYKTVEALIEAYQQDPFAFQHVNIVLTPKQDVTPAPEPAQPKVAESVATNGMHKITVKAYMTRPSTPDFDFMLQWNNNVPMPFRTMVGEVVKQTAKMQYMKLHADIVEEQATTCMCCGRTLTNKVSQYFGIGPECGGHNYVNPFSSKEELIKAVNAYRKHLNTITWEGWVIKSAILEDQWIINEEV